MSRSLDRLLPPLDLHAHVDPTVTSAQLSTLGPAFVFTVTRSTVEAESVARRRDDRLIWGAGVHPGIEGHLQSFSLDAFERAATHLGFVGEVGLDSRNDTPTARRVLAEVTRWARAKPLFLSVHTSGRAGPAIELLGPAMDQVVLHWFRGTPSQVQEAAAAGAYFSVNVAMTDEQLTCIPVDRALPETDFPFTKRHGSKLPGDIEKLEARIGGLWGMTQYEVRRAWYRNLRALCRHVGCLDRLPPELLAALLSV